MSRLAAELEAECARLLRDVYLPRLRAAARALSEDDLWWRPHDASTSAGNLLLHLEGNVRQWILSGLGGVEDRRERAEEFAPRARESASALLQRLEHTTLAAADLIEDFDEARLTERVLIQGTETTPLGAILHVVEHFSWHTGQITWIAKARAGPTHGIAFYDDASLNAPRGG